MANRFGQSSRAESQVRSEVTTLDGKREQTGVCLGPIARRFVLLAFRPTLRMSLRPRKSLAELDFFPAF